MFQDGIRGEQPEIASFLMAGQSNMAGRGNVGDVEPIRNPRCFMLRNGRWQPMTEPINVDRPVFEGTFRSGISLAASFADEFSRACGRSVGLIPCAEGGSSIEEWEPGGPLFDHAMLQTKLALRSSVLQGILWHQGENDAIQEDRIAAYPERLEQLIARMREELGEEIPFLIGELSEEISPDTGITRDAVRRMNAIFYEKAAKLSRVTVISAQGLPLKPDGIHFSAAACREFGRRYFEGYRAHFR